MFDQKATDSHEEYVLRELEIAFAQADAGQFSDLSMDEILAEAHRRCDVRRNSYKKINVK